MHGHTLVLHHLAGQDEVFGLLLDAPDAAGSRFAPHRDEGEGLLADAEVLLEHLPSFAGAHGPHPVQLPRVDEGLRGSVAAPVVPDVALPLVLVRRGGSALSDVSFEEGLEAVVPFGGLAGGVVFPLDWLSQQGAESQSEKHSGSRHYPAVLIVTGEVT